jgi:hypothetical protein
MRGVKIAKQHRIVGQMLRRQEQRGKAGSQRLAERTKFLQVVGFSERNIPCSEQRFGSFLRRLLAVKHGAGWFNPN